MEGYPPILMFSLGLLIDKCPFQDGAMPGKNCPFQGTLSTSMAHSSVEHRRPHCKQDERSLLPCYAV